MSAAIGVETSAEEDKVPVGGRVDDGECRIGITWRDRTRSHLAGRIVLVEIIAGHGRFRLNRYLCVEYCRTHEGRPGWYSCDAYRDPEAALPDIRCVRGHKADKAMLDIVQREMIANSQRLGGCSVVFLQKTVAQSGDRINDVRRRRARIAGIQVGIRQGNAAALDGENRTIVRGAKDKIALLKAGHTIQGQCVSTAEIYNGGASANRRRYLRLNVCEREDARHSTDVDLVVLSAVKIRDGVRPTAVGINEGVGAAAAGERIIAAPAAQPIVAALAVQGIGIGI